MSMGSPQGTTSKAPPDGFAELYHSHFGRVATQLYAYLGDHAEAQDLAQEAFCRALERWDKISRYDDPSAWVRRVAWNLATSRLRRVKVAVRHLSRQREEHVPGPDPDHVALVRALATLSPSQRKAIVLYHLCHLNVAEIAAQENAAEGTVRSWLTRGRAALAAYFTETMQEAHRG
jgi:RNA polymerase sigma-70 factor (ECF subfamily)